MRPRPPRRPERPSPTAHRRGRLGEELAAEALAASGYRCVSRNLRTRGGEIDLLVRKRRLWVAVEVKTRSGHPGPELLVGDATLLRLQQALAGLAPVLRPRPRLLRVDVVAVILLGDRVDLRHFLGEPFPPPAAR